MSVLETAFKEIAGAIRKRKKTTEKIPFANFEQEIFSLPSEKWVRPFDRPEVPEIVEGEQVAYILFGVTESSPNDYALRLNTSIGQYVIDWGDGEVTYYYSNVTAEHMYNYETLNVPVGNEGYKWVWIKTYPVSGNLTTLGIEYRPSWRGSNVFYPQVFEFYIQGPYILNPFNFSDTSLTKYKLAEIFDFKGPNSIVNFSQFLSGWSNLKILNIDISKGIIFQYFLKDCSSFNYPINQVFKIDGNATYFMQNCYSFNQPINVQVVENQSLTNFLNNCWSFNQSINIIGKPISMSNFLSGCISFNQQVNVDTSLATVLNVFLSGCAAFNKSIVLDVSKVTNNAYIDKVLSTSYLAKGLRLKNLQIQITSLNFQGLNFDVPALRDLFSDLTDRTTTTSGTITITGCYGTGRLTAEDRAIATSKNWTIVG